MSPAVRYIKTVVFSLCLAHFSKQAGTRKTLSGLRFGPYRRYSRPFGTLCPFLPSQSSCRCLELQKPCSVQDRTGLMTNILFSCLLLLDKYTKRNLCRRAKRMAPSIVRRLVPRQGCRPSGRRRFCGVQAFSPKAKPLAEGRQSRPEY